MVRSGPPSDQVQDYSVRVKTLLDKLNVINYDELEAANGLYWTIYLDLLVLNDDGNLFDAIWLATIASLHDSTYIMILLLLMI